MSTRGNNFEAIDVLIRRIEVIESLLEGSKNERTLVDDLNISRSTVDRAVRELESLTLVAHSNNGIELTLCGYLAAEEYRRLETRVTELYHQPKGGHILAGQWITTVAKRAGMVESLLVEPREKRALVEHLGVSRSTVDRATQELEGVSMIERASAGLQPTKIGREAAQEYWVFKQRLEGLLAVPELLSVLDAGIDLDLAMLVGAEIVRPNRVAPHVLGTHMEEQIREADRLTIMARAYTHAPSMELFYTLVVNKGVRIECVLPSDMVEFIQSAHPEQFARMIEQEHFTASAVGETPFGLFILESGSGTQVCLLVYDKGNKFKGIIKNTSYDAVEWGERIYQEYQKRAERVPA